MFLYIKCSGSKSVIWEIIVLCYVIKNTKRVTDWTTAKPAKFISVEICIDELLLKMDL